MRRLSRFSEFINESILNESVVVFSDRFKKLLSKIDSPVAKSLLDIETKDLDVANNYIDIADNKNQITFITDRKAKELLSSPEAKKVTHMGSGHLTHSEANNNVFNALGYTPEGPQTYHPQSGEEGVIESEYTSPTSGNVYCKVVFPGGISVINKARLRPVDLSKLPFSKNRQPGRIGASVQALLRSADVTYSNAEIEQFVNKYKSEFDKFNDAFRNFELVSGKEIHHWYQASNYLHGTSKGQLSNSCMGRAPERWLEIYTMNPDVCQLLILKDDDQQDKIKGRALVWKLTQPVGITYVDRIYTHDDSDLELFKQYIKEQGWYLKNRYTSSTSDTTMIAPDGSESRPRELIVKVDAREYSGYPYLDTFKFYTPSSGKLSTDSGDYQLEDTGGGYSNQECEYCGGDGYNECGECYGRGNVRCGECDNGKLECPECEGEGSIQCSTCDGSGGDASSDPCPDCNGDGVQACPDCQGDGNRDCPDCDGNGRTECEECGGEGQQPCSECNW
jgi:hypothetical protein